MKSGMELYYFYTPFCGTCKVAAKMLDVVEEHIKPVPIKRINVNLHPDDSLKYGIESVPSLVILKDGQVQQTIYAFQSVVYLIDQIEKNT